MIPAPSLSKKGPPPSTLHSSFSFSVYLLCIDLCISRLAR